MRFRKLPVFLATLFLPAWLHAQDYTIQIQSGIFTPPANGPVTQKLLPNEVINGKYYRLIQFYKLPTEAEKKRLAGLGVQLENYLPANTYTALISASLDPALLGSNVRALFPMQAAQKLSADLTQKKYPAHALQGLNTIALNLVQQPGLSASQVAAWLEREGVRVLATSQEAGMHQVAVPVSTILSVAALPYVAYLEPVEAPPTPENLPGRTSHRSNTLMTDYKNGLKLDGAGVTVALNDDGIIGPHIDYTGRIGAQYISSNNGDHGDHCAGTIFGAGNLNPVARGMAPGATLRVYGVGGGGPTNYQAFDSIYRHYQNLGVRITSTSYGNGRNAGYTSLARIMDQQITDMPELMHVFSAGNDGNTSSSYGAGVGWGNVTGGHKVAKNSIAVGNLDSNDRLAASSSRGPASDGRIKPEVTAVGTKVFSTIDANDYDFKTGTSMACPGMAGTLAQLYQGWKVANGGMNPQSALIKAAVLNTADDLGNPGPDFKFGFGRINARRAYKLLTGQQFFRDSLSQGGNRNYTIQVPAGTAEVRVLLYWHDKPATSGALRALVNNLDLKVITPASSIIYPWKLNTAPNATALDMPAVQGIDSLNNVEQVTIPTPAAGAYNLSVTAPAVPMGPQTYYVVYEMVSDGVTLTYPLGGEGLVTGVPEVVRWDAAGNSGPFNLSYSTDSGATWSPIANNLPATQRHYNWTPPFTPTGRALVRVVRGASTSTSAAVFTVMGVPSNVTFDWVCADSMRVSYPAVPGAAGYVVTMLGNTYMDSVATATTTSCVVRGVNTMFPRWVAVQAVAANGGLGRRSIARLSPAVPFNCTVPQDLAVDTILTPQVDVTRCSGNTASERVRIVVKNYGLSAFSGINVGYSVNGGAAVTAVLPGTLAPQASDTFTFTTPLAFNSVGTQELRVWAKHPNDVVPANDTAVQSVTFSIAPAQSLPLVQDFETFNTCDTTADCGTMICPLTAGWQNGSSDDAIDWRIWSGPTPSAAAGTGPMQDFAPGTFSGKYAYLEADGCYGKTAHLLSPCVDLSGINAAQLRFAYHMKGADMGELHVDLFVDGNWINDICPPLTGDQGGAWKIASFGLPSSVMGKSIQLRFRGITGPGFRSDIALDGISLTDPGGVSTISETVAVSVFPNPSTSAFTVNVTGLTSASELTVTDMQGQVVERQQLTPQGGQVTTLVPLQGAGAGVYFLSIRSGEGVAVRKLIRL